MAAISTIMVRNTDATYTVLTVFVKSDGDIVSLTIVSLFSLSGRKFISVKLFIPREKNR